MRPLRASLPSCGDGSGRRVWTGRLPPRSCVCSRNSPKSPRLRQASRTFQISRASGARSECVMDRAAEPAGGGAAATLHGGGPDGTAASACGGQAGSSIIRAQTSPRPGRSRTCCAATGCGQTERDSPVRYGCAGHAGWPRMGRSAQHSLTASGLPAQARQKFRTHSRSAPSSQSSIRRHACRGQEAWAHSRTRIQLFPWHHRQILRTTPDIPFLAAMHSTPWSWRIEPPSQYARKRRASTLKCMPDACRGHGSHFQKKNDRRS